MNIIRKVAVPALFTLTAALAAVLTAPVALAQEVYFISPSDGDTVENPVKVVFGLRGMGVAPAGVEMENTGHHHLLIDVDELTPSGIPIPADERHVHFGAGQTETTIELSPGEHTLQLLIGDFLHRPSDPPVASEKITITVK